MGQPDDSGRESELGSVGVVFEKYLQPWEKVPGAEWHNGIPEPTNKRSRRRWRKARKCRSHGFWDQYCYDCQGKGYWPAMALHMDHRVVETQLFEHTPSDATLGCQCGFEPSTNNVQHANHQYLRHVMDEMKRLGFIQASQRRF